MRVGDTHYHTIWFDEAAGEVKIIDQRWLPHEFRVVGLRTLDDFATAIRDMWVRGAPLIGATAAWGLAMEAARDASDDHLEQAAQTLLDTRPTAVNLCWAVSQMLDVLFATSLEQRPAAARQKAQAICDADVRMNESIGEHGLKLIREIAARKPEGEPVRILTHCNAGWLATVDWGTATAPIYKAHDAGLNVLVWVDETRPRNQGAHLTAWELAGHGVPHRLIVDNAGGHLMQQGLVDMVIVGTDRTTACGDVANKIGTYLKALAAHDNNVPFYVALPSPTIDWTLCDGRDIPIEERDEDEVRLVWGRLPDGGVTRVQICPDATRAANPAFDVTPARYVTGLITERGVCAASREGLRQLFPEQGEDGSHG